MSIQGFQHGTPSPFRATCPKTRPPASARPPADPPGSRCGNDQARSAFCRPRSSWPPFRHAAFDSVPDGRPPDIMPEHLEQALIRVRLQFGFPALPFLTLGLLSGPRVRRRPFMGGGSLLPPSLCARVGLGLGCLIELGVELPRTARADSVAELGLRVIANVYLDLRPIPFIIANLLA